MSIRPLLAAAGFLVFVAGCGTSSVVAPRPSVPLSSLSLIPGADTLHVGEVASFSVVAVDTQSVVVANPVLVWSSSSSSVFRVSSAGMVTAAGEGTATLSVSSGGKTATASLLVLPTQTGWFTQTSSVAAVDLHGVFFTSDGNYGWAVGTTGKIIATSNAGATWTTQTSPVGTTLNSVWFTSSTEGWAAGDLGRIVHTTNRGATWSQVSITNTSVTLYGITFATPDTGWAVGANGTILRTADHGLTWQHLPLSITTFTLRGVAFAGTRDGWAVGDNGIIVGTHDRGLTWFIVQPGITTLALHGVYRDSAPSTHAVGTGGATPRTTQTPPDSVVWEYRNAGASNDLRAVTFTDSLHGWAVGRNGTSLVLVTTNGGVTWTQQTTTPAALLLSVRFVDSMRGWAVGENGTILHTVTGGAP